MYFSYLLYGLLHDRYLLEKFRTLINCFNCLHLNLVQITCARKGNRKRAYLLLIYIRLLIILNLKWISIQSSLLRYEILKMVDFSKLFGIIFQSVCKKSIINVMIWSRIFEVCVIDGMRVRYGTCFYDGVSTFSSTPGSQPFKIHTKVWWRGLSQKTLKSRWLCSETVSMWSMKTKSGYSRSKMWVLKHEICRNWEVDWCMKRVVPANEGITSNCKSITIR